MRILKLSKLKGQFTRYDLSIEGVHNFVAEGAVVHNTSTHISWNHNNQTVKFFSGGASHEAFKSLFDEESLKAKFQEQFPDKSVIVYGEGYGGKEQGMSKTYGPNLCFTAFDIQVDDWWLETTNAHQVATSLGLEFVPYRVIPATVEALNAERDLPSEVAVRRGCGNNKDKFGFCPPIREGIVVRPVMRCYFEGAERIVSKHKRIEFSERKSDVQLGDEVKMKALADAEAIATEWVTPMRLSHVLDKLGNPSDISKVPDVIKAMIEDVYREGAGEIVESKDANKAIGKKTVFFYKKHITAPEFQTEEAQ